MRILMISKALVVGAYHKKISELVALGVELHLVIPTTWGKQVPEITQGNGYTIYTLPIRFSGENHFHFYHNGLFAVVDAVRPDLLHVDEEAYSLVTFQAMRLAKKNKTPALFFTWQNIHKRYPFPFSSIERYNYEIARVAIAGNHEAKDVLRRKGFAKDIFVIPQFGVDPKLYSRQIDLQLKAGLFQSSQAQIIGFIGRLHEQKGIFLLLEALSRLPESARLLLIGNGPDEKKIPSVAARFGVGHRVKVIHSVPSEKVPQYLSCFDCLTLPSLTRSNWKEQFGRVLIEAMACEVPVIGSDSAEIPNVIGDAGLIVKEGDVSDLYEKINMILSNPQLKDDLRQRGLARVRNNFTQKHVALETVQVYRQVLEGRSA
jgi:glycosyltransferase involved in cell wall biosynthesis